MLSIPLAVEEVTLVSYEIYSAQRNSFLSENLSSCFLNIFGTTLLSVILTATKINGIQKVVLFSIHTTLILPPTTKLFWSVPHNQRESKSLHANTCKPLK